MSVYATVKTESDPHWFVSVAVFLTDEPVRVNHGDAEWYLTADESLRLWEALDALYGARYET